METIFLTGLIEGKFRHLNSLTPDGNKEFVSRFKKHGRDVGTDYDILWISDINEQATVHSRFVVYDKNFKQFMAENEVGWTYSTENAQIYCRELLN